MLTVCAHSLPPPHRTDITFGDNVILVHMLTHNLMGISTQQKTNPVVRAHEGSGVPIVWHNITIPMDALSSNSAQISPVCQFEVCRCAGDDRSMYVRVGVCACVRVARSHTRLM